MNSFQIIQPSMLLAPYVKQYWFLTMKNVEQISQRLVPFGCTALSFYRSNRTYSLFEEDYLPQSHLYGVATDYMDITFSGDIDLICVIFQPMGAKAFFKMPLSELSSSYVSLDDLGDSELRHLECQLNESSDDWVCIGMIEQFLFQRLYRLNQYNQRRINAVIHSINNGESNVSRLAESVCLGYKQFKRIFTETIGVNPKDYMKINRFQKLHCLLQQHTDKTIEQLADEFGYYDKSHLIKELREFSGFTPTELQETCDVVYSDYHALFRSAFVDLSE